MTLLIKGGGKKKYDDDNVIEVPKDETPVYLEWTLWRAALAIGHIVNKPYDVRGFRLDSDFMPISVAGGGKGDLYCEFENFTILTEVTMSTSSRQEAMEGEPVRRHVADAVLSYNKPVYGMFIAIRIDTNTAETFRHGVWYTRGDEKQRLNIIPFTLDQFQRYFECMFINEQATPYKLVELIEHCARKRDMMEAPAWKEYIDDAINYGIHSFNQHGQDQIAAEQQAVYSTNKKETIFPYGLLFGSMIRDKVKGKVGCIVGIKKEYVLVAFEGEVEPCIVPASADFFEKGFYELA